MNNLLTDSIMLKTYPNISLSKILLMILAVIVFGIIMIIISKVCVNIERASGRSAYSVLKIALVAIPPTVFTVISMFEISVPNSIIIIAAIVACVVVLVWNILTFGILGGILFSFMHIVFGLLAGISIAALIIIVLFFGILYLFGAFSVGGTGTASGGNPHTVRDVNSGESFHVIERNGTLFLDSGGRCGVLRPSDYAGRYIDDSGNDYIAV